MRKRMLILALAMVLCTGCGFREDPYKIDTVVRIPVNPTGAPRQTEEPTVAEAPETEKPTESETEAPTETPKKPSSGGNKSSGNKGSSNKKEETKPRETEPKETKPMETNPAETKPEETQPSVTEPENTRPEETVPPQTQPPETEVPETEPEDDLYDISGYTVGSLEYAIRDRINAARTENELAEYSFSSRLSAIASCRANEISAVWSHTRPDGRHYSTVLDDYGYSAGAVTELLVYITGNGDAEEIVSKWLSSDSHRESLLGGYSTIGIGVYRSGGYTYVCCLLVA